MQNSNEDSNNNNNTTENGSIRKFIKRGEGLPVINPTTPGLINGNWTEFLGTVIIVAMGIAIYQLYLNSGQLAVAILGNGLLLGTVITFTMRFNSGFFDPNYTLVAWIFYWLQGRCKFTTALLQIVTYCISQLLGALLGGLIVWGIFGWDNAIGTPILNNITQARAWWSVFISSAFAVYGRLSLQTDVKSRHFSSFNIGVSVGLYYIVISAFQTFLTGGVINVWRWFIPALLTSTWDDGWVWATGLFAGAFLGMFVLLISQMIAAVDGNKSYIYGTFDRKMNMVTVVDKTEKNDTINNKIGNQFGSPSNMSIAKRIQQNKNGNK